MTIFERVKSVVRFILRMDITLLVLVTCLFSFSIYAIHYIGIEAGGSFEAYAKKQFVWVCIGFVLMLVIASVDYEWIGVNSWVFYILGLLLLLLVLIPGIGKEINGARSWIPMPGGATIQPSEIAKPCTLVALAWYASRPRVLLHEFTKLIPVVLIAGGPVILIGLQPDFGSALVFIPLTAVVLLVAGCKMRYLTYPIFMALVLTPIM
ncbi:MAG: FtsW/RodA/SpoVE family cell cycle protein [Lentisphaeraceae bacterium]|nr:FtsW/RodA/SpoVE family cell cycle protein [Lentisphaeraceae bacterium]